MATQQICDFCGRTITEAINLTKQGTEDTEFDRWECVRDFAAQFVPVGAPKPEPTPGKKK